MGHCGYDPWGFLHLSNACPHSHVRVERAGMRIGSRAEGMLLEIRVVYLDDGLGNRAYEEHC